ncbi:hypothetical protein [Quadrisphaera sp. DSM 44207]|uniref:hypothetical protein n=1 Tax=Quadrisphaera sp. DSM 44207 TaxID=1881057 RepID=UPI00088372C1|nr:hypothetical protein [Quadrisphaera sp. DSM 44207]SDQ87140.1 hypothetical protein SAMN05428996_2971 [Quadrisphaera sp. DSM 44207]
MTEKTVINTADGQSIEAVSGTEVDLDAHPITLPTGRVIDEAGAAPSARGAPAVPLTGPDRTGRPDLGGQRP